jgi:hypothetical protein
MSKIWIQKYAEWEKGSQNGQQSRITTHLNLSDLPPLCEDELGSD